jgi:hypothetical protein
MVTAGLQQLQAALVAASRAAAAAAARRGLVCSSRVVSTLILHSWLRWKRLCWTWILCCLKGLEMCLVLC